MYSVHPVSQKEAIVKDRPLAIPNNIYINSSFLLLDSLVRQMLWEEQTEHWRYSGTDITDYMFLLMILCGSIHVSDALAWLIMILFMYTRILKMAGYENVTSDNSRDLPMNSSIRRGTRGRAGRAIRGPGCSHV